MCSQAELMSHMHTHMHTQFHPHSPTTTLQNGFGNVAERKDGLQHQHKKIGTRNARKLKTKQNYKHTHNIMYIAYMNMLYVGMHTHNIYF